MRVASLPALQHILFEIDEAARPCGMAIYTRWPDGDYIGIHGISGARQATFPPYSAAFLHVVASVQQALFRSFPCFFDALCLMGWECVLTMQDAT